MLEQIDIFDDFNKWNGDFRNEKFKNLNLKTKRNEPNLKTFKILKDESG